MWSLMRSWTEFQGQGRLQVSGLMMKKVKLLLLDDSCNASCHIYGNLERSQSIHWLHYLQVWWTLVWWTLVWFMYTICYEHVQVQEQTTSKLALLIISRVAKVAHRLLLWLSHLRIYIIVHCVKFCDFFGVWQRINMLHFRPRLI